VEATGIPSKGGSQVYGENIVLSESLLSHVCETQSECNLYRTFNNKERAVKTKLCCFIQICKKKIE